ncbi:MAG: phosphotransferase enzyme family protein, partial [Bacteroidetes bacterium HGW-Bacteroidetes-21]
ARMPLNLTEKNELLRHYINELNKTSADVVSFEKYFPYYLLLRLFQALGAYGYRGWFEKKESFINMLPLAAKNLNELQPWFGFLSEMPEISKVVQQIIRNFSIQQIPEKLASDKLIVRIFSFSYKNRIPEDISGNGGGFIFDCRALPNPGKYEQYKANSGLDQDVKDFLAAELAVNSYIDKVFAIVSQSVEKYIARDFSNLMVSFGCTGGQHRSVYCAEKLATYLKQKYKITIEVEHMEKNVWGKGSAS